RIHRLDRIVDDDEPERAVGKHRPGEEERQGEAVDFSLLATPTAAVSVPYTFTPRYTRLRFRAPLSSTLVSSTLGWRRNEAHRPIAWSAMGWNRCERMVDVAAASASSALFRALAWASWARASRAFSTVAAIRTASGRQVSSRSAFKAAAFFWSCSNSVASGGKTALRCSANATGSAGGDAHCSHCSRHRSVPRPATETDSSK